MSITKNIIDSMGGTIKLESEKGQGTKFIVDVSAETITRERDDANNHEAVEQQSSDSCKLSGKHVLLCEDHPINQEIAIKLLEQKEMTVELAEDGKIGVDKFALSVPGTYDAVLMDIRMPNMTGYEAARAIRAMDRADAGTVPIIAMTADAFDDDVQRCREAGMNAHVSKPIDPQLLYSALASLIK